MRSPGYYASGLYNYMNYMNYIIVLQISRLQTCNTPLTAIIISLSFQLCLNKMVGKAHFHRLSKSLACFRENGFLTDCAIVTDQGLVELHKLVLFAFSLYQHEKYKGSNTDGKYFITAKGFSLSDIENLVKFLYNSEATITLKSLDIIKSLKLDLSVDAGAKKKMSSKCYSFENLLNLELKYLRNILFEIEIPEKARVDTDVCIKTGSDLHKCHKIILSACSKYFEVMFASGMKETSDEVVDLHGVATDTFSVILNYMYTGHLAATVSNAQDLMSTSVYLQIEALQTLCEDFLQHQLDTDNCVDMWMLGCTYSCSALQKGSWSFIVDHFCKIPKLKILKSFQHHDMRLLLSDDNLNVDDEKVVLKCLLEWISIHKREDLLDDLFEVARLSLVDIDYLEDIAKNNANVLRSERCFTLIKDTLSGKMSLFQRQKTRKEKTFVVMKRSSYTTGIEIAAYSLTQKKWYSLQSFTKCAGGTGFSACVEGDSIYVTGGTATPRGHYQFSTEENKWFELPEMTQGRSSHSCGYVNRFLYVLGGSDVSAGSFNILSSVEKYNPEEKCWTKVGDMKIPTYDSAYAVVKSRIYIFGGSMGLTSGVYIKDIQCFDTVTDTCTILYHNMPFTLSLATACTHNRNIYIICPNGKLVHYNEEEMPSVISDSKALQLMGFATLYHEEAIFILGGYSMTGESDAIHRVDLKSKMKCSKTVQMKLPFKKQSNQLFACVMHISRKFLVEESVLESPRKEKKIASSR